MQAEPVTAGTARTEVIDVVPDDVFARVTQDFRDSGATEIKVEPNPDGTWKISATFRNQQ